MTSSPQDPQNPTPPGNVVRLDTLAREGRALDAPLPEDPAARLRQFGRLRQPEQWAYVRETLQPMLLRRMKYVDIAQRFDVSVDTVYRWRDRLQAEMRQEAVNIQPRDFIMESIESVRAVRGEAWAGYYAASGQKEKDRMMSLVLRADEQLIRLGAAVGMFGGRDDKPLAAKTYGEDGGREPTSGLGLLQDLVKQFLGNPYRTGSKETDTELLGTVPDEPQQVAQQASEDPYAGLFEDMGEYDSECLPEPDPPSPAPQLPPGITVRRRQRPKP